MNRSKEAWSVEWLTQQGRMQQIVSNHVLIGSDINADICLKEEGVASIHVELFIRNNRVFVHSLGSGADIRLNGVQIENACWDPIFPLSVGQVEMSLRRVEAVVESSTIQNIFGNLIGQSDAMQEMFIKMVRIASNDEPVLIQGQSGSGKSLVASSIHSASNRAAGPFVKVSCARCDIDDIEKTLFGSERNEFLGRTVIQQGALQLGHHGSVLIEDAEFLPLRTQVLLMRFMKFKKLNRIGNIVDIACDTRVFLETRHDIRQLVNKNSFRHDFYFALHPNIIFVPSLEERQDDVEILSKWFAKSMSLHDYSYDNFIKNQPWRCWDNVRGLCNLIKSIKT